MNMYPDRQIEQDTNYIIITFISIIIGFAVMCSDSMGYAPADQCANDVRQSLSPHQTAVLTEHSTMPVPYSHIRTWCTAHLNDYEAEIDRAQDSIPEFGRVNLNLDEYTY
jgi:hypothetical protein